MLLSAFRIVPASMLGCSRDGSVHLHALAAVRRPRTPTEGIAMKRAILAASVFVAGAMLAITGIAAPPSAPADAPVAPGIVSLMDKQLHWGMTHIEVTEVYNGLAGLFDREYAPQIAKLQPGTEMQQLEADKDNRKSNFMRSYTVFGDSPTGYDVTALHGEYTYK